MGADQTPGLVQSYERRNNQFGPATYRDSSLTDKILKSGRLRSLSHGSTIADLMSGPGKLGLSIEDALPDRQHRYLYLDFTPAQLAKIPDAPHRTKVFTDIRDAKIDPKSIDVAVARYSFKDLPASDQPSAFKSVHQSIRPGGRLVIVDMVAPNDELKDWTNDQHSLKQELGGRNIDQEGKCNIRTNAGWTEALATAGFLPAVTGEYISKVTTTDWLNSGQVDDSQLEELNRFILAAPSAAKQAYNIRQTPEGVKIDFPVTIISAWKAYSSR